MKKLKLDLDKLKVDSFEITNIEIKNKGTARAYCDENSNQTGTQACISIAHNCSLQYCTDHTCYREECDVTYTDNQQLD